MRRADKHRLQLQITKIQKHKEHTDMVMAARPMFTCEECGFIGSQYRSNQRFCSARCRFATWSRLYGSKQ